MGCLLHLPSSWLSLGDLCSRSSGSSLRCSLLGVPRPPSVSRSCHFVQSSGRALQDPGSSHGSQLRECRLVGVGLLVRRGLQSGLYLSFGSTTRLASRSGSPRRTPKRSLATSSSAGILARNCFMEDVADSSSASTGERDVPAPRSPVTVAFIDVVPDAVSASGFGVLRGDVPLSAGSAIRHCCKSLEPL